MWQWLKVNQSCHPYQRELFKAGWAGARQCDCDETLGVLNCRGTASAIAVAVGINVDRRHGGRGAETSSSSSIINEPAELFDALN